MLFELRRYRCKDGKRDEWVALMESRIIPMQIAKGMSIVGSFVDEGDPDVYVWIRRFDSEEERKRLYEAVYKSEEWLNELSPLVDELLYRDQIEVTRLNPTAASALH
jgi:NIPSNAP